MKFKTVQTILMAAQSNQQHGVIKMHSDLRVLQLHQRRQWRGRHHRL